MEKYDVLLSKATEDKILKVGTFEECKAGINKLDEKSVDFMAVEKEVYDIGFALHRWTFTSDTNKYYIFECEK